MAISKTFPTRQAALDHVADIGIDVSTALKAAADLWKTTPEHVVRFHDVFSLIVPVRKQQRSTMHYTFRAETKDISGPTILNID